MIGTLVIAAIAIACVRLGFWQLDRLEQRRERNALIAERMDAPPVAFDRIGRTDADAAWRRVRLEGGCEGAGIVLAARSLRGAPGVHLLCRFRTDGGRAVLLDRGWVHSWDARTVADSVWRPAPRDTALEALLVPFPPGEVEPSAPADGAPSEVADDEAGPRVMYRLNRAQAMAAAGIELPDYYAQAIGAPAGATAPAEGAPARSGPRPHDLPALDEGSHLSYAVQWFSFAAIALIGWVLLMLRGRTARPAPGKGPPVPPIRD